MKLAGRVATGLSLLLLAAGAVCARPLFGFTPFPYDATAQAVARTQEILREGATIHAIHMDDGIPWEELLEGRALPKRVQKEWDDLARAVPPGRPVYLGLAPLAKDRKSLAQGKGEKDFLALPWSLKLAALDDDKVKSAYLEYARRAVVHFKPAYLNLGIEAGELASRDPKRWPQFEALYRHVAGALKRDFPQLKIGISFGLQGLRKPETAQRVRALVEASDYIGLSFYPHASPFGERFGEPALGEGAQAWREPLEWVRAFTKKPIAICETGYLSNTVAVKSFNLQLKGDIDLQTQYVRELAQFAERDDYLFVVWFLAVDYDRLFERMGGATAANDVNLLWRNIGLWTGDVKPKPAWEEWKRAVAGRSEGAPPRSLPAAANQAPVVAAATTKPAAPEPSATRTDSAAEVGFTAARQLFQTSPNGEAALEPDAGMRWSYAYKKDEWSWAARDLGLTLRANTQRVKLRLRSDRPGALFVQLEESSGETFFAMVNPGKDWTDVLLDLSSLKPDPAKRKDGVLQPERIVKLLLADPAGRDKVDGRRSVWISNWSFD
jgi:hypothetical protein